ncbi:MAG: HAD family phosphatase [Cyclobacteriaceae bacterium]|nr:HAD family phosphatase [Cyclobacteriaceae bacterium]
MKTQKIENIIFDLGGVIIDLDMEHTFDRFSQLFGRDVRAKMMDDPQNHFFFHQFEIGAIDEAEFRHALRNFTHTDLDDQRLDLAWNAMLGDIPKHRIEWIEALAAQYKVAILSNTNSIHIRRFHEIFAQTTTYKHPNELFHNIYYSHEISDRKPNASCYRKVLDDLGANPAKTIFLDDNHANLKAAAALGMQTVLVERNLLRREQLPNGR